MDVKFKIVMLLRTCSIMILSYIPSFYLFEVLPPFVLPVWSLIIIYLCCKIEKHKIKFSASFILISSSCIIFWLLVLLICKIISHEFFDILYLYLTIIIPFIIFQTFFISFITIIFLKNKKFQYYEPIIFFIIFCLLFLPQSNYSLTIFEYPIYGAIFASVFFILQLTGIFFYLNFRKKIIRFFIVFLPLLTVIIFFILKNYTAMSIVNNGGLLKQNFFKFDFSNYLTLQHEIKINDDLVLITHFDKDFSHNMLRRLYLSGWDPAKGFYEKKAPNEKQQLYSVPKSEKLIAHTKFDLRQNIAQEYFFINMAPSSFISMDYPTKIIPYRIWDSLKFNGGYKVFSDAVYSFADDIYSFDFPSGNIEEGLNKKDLEFYTTIDDKTLNLVHDKAVELTAEVETYSDKILAIQEYFLNGDFRYSLKPGKAPDGNQLRFFLQEAKKGYCTYYAFSFALMLRSIGIPARVAVGFFVQPESGILNYYPVRSNMAHAWTEVFFPYIGWISFDATTSILAEGENLNFSQNAGGEEFNSLLTEILEKRNDIKIMDLITEDISSTNNIKLFFKTNKNIFVFAVLLFAIFTIFVYKIYPYAIIKFSKNNRKIILTIAGIIRKKRITKDTDIAVKILVQKAKFSNLCSNEDVQDALKIFNAVKKRRNFNDEKNF